MPTSWSDSAARLVLGILSLHPNPVFTHTHMLDMATCSSNFGRWWKHKQKPQIFKIKQNNNEALESRESNLGVGDHRLWKSRVFHLDLGHLWFNIWGWKPKVNPIIDLRDPRWSNHRRSFLIPHRIWKYGNPHGIPYCLWELAIAHVLGSPRTMEIQGGNMWANEMYFCSLGIWNHPGDIFSKQKIYSFQMGWWI